MAQDFDLTGAMPFDRDASDARPGVLAVGPFLYIGTGLTAQAFTAYVASYNFGRVPPSYIVLHHTAVPSTRAARYPTGAVWDAGEEGMSEARIYQKRTKQLDSLAKYYQDTMGWDRGFHLAIDDRWIWCFTPMNAVGIHAKEGNSYAKDGKLHYSIGVEVIGYYEKVTWPAPVAANVRAALQALSVRLGIKLTYTAGPAHTPSAHAGALSSHRDYNKPACPGAAITEAYYTSVVAPPPPPYNPARYRVKKIMISERAAGGPPYAGELAVGEVVEIDMTYPSGQAHLMDGRGFVLLADLEPFGMGAL